MTSTGQLSIPIPGLSGPSTMTKVGPIPNTIYNPINQAWGEFVTKTNQQANEFEQLPVIQNAMGKQAEFNTKKAQLEQNLNDQYAQWQANVGAAKQNAEKITQGAKSSILKKQNPAIFSQGF